MRREGLIVTAIAAGLMALLGLLLLALYIFAPLIGGRGLALGDEQRVSSAAQYAVLGLYGLVFGGIVLGQSIAAICGKPSPRFRLPLAWGLIAVVAFAIAVPVGIAVLKLPVTQASYLFPWLQLVTVLAPPLLAFELLRSAGRSAPLVPAVATGGIAGRTSRDDPYAIDLLRRVVGPPSWRRVIGALTWGLSGAITISMVLEIVALVGFGLLALLLLAASGQSLDPSSLRNAISSTGLDCSTLRSLTANPLVVGGMVLFLGVAGPIIEETAKSLAVVLLRRRLTSASAAVLYGAAAGVGFGMIESAIYNVGDLNYWWGTATIRAGTTLIHALATALFGLGWYTLFRGGGRRGFLRYAGAGVLVHGLWNTMTVGIIVISAQRACRTDTFGLVESGDPVGYLLLALMVAAAIAAGVLLYTLTRRTARLLS